MNFLSDNKAVEAKIAQAATGRITLGDENAAIDIRGIADLPDIFIVLMRKTVYRDSDEKADRDSKELFAHFGEAIDNIPGIHRKHNTPHLFERLGKTLQATTEKIASNFSYALLMACAGLCIVFCYLLIIY